MVKLVSDEMETRCPRPLVGAYQSGLAPQIPSQLRLLSHTEEEEDGEAGREVGERGQDSDSSSGDDCP